MGTTAQPQAADEQPQSTTAVVGGGAPDAGEMKQSKTALAIGTLPDDVKQALTLKRQLNIVTAEIIGTNWGKGLDRETRFRIAEWSRAAGIDPATELHVLGGNFYKNAVYYIRRQTELMADGIIEFAYAEHVEVNKELTAMAQRTDEAGAWAKAELDRRAQQRVMFNIPPEAVSSVVWHVKVKGVPVEFVAAKWCGGGTRKSDPVGDQFPVETSETRAARRTMRLLAEWRPSDPRLRALVEPNDDDRIDADIGETLRAGLKRAKEDATRSLEQARGHNILSLNAGDPYAGEPVQPRKDDEPVAVVPAPIKASGEITTATTMPVRTPTPIPAGLRLGDDNFTDEPDTRPNGTVPGDTTAEPADDINDLDLLTPDERAEYDRRKRAGR